MPEDKIINKVQEVDKNVIKTKGVTLEEARKVLLNEQKSNSLSVAKEVNKILDKHGYSFRVEHQVTIVPIGDDNANLFRFTT